LISKGILVGQVSYSNSNSLSFAITTYKNNKQEHISMEKKESDTSNSAKKPVLNDEIPVNKY